MPGMGSVNMAAKGTEEAGVDVEAQVVAEAAENMVAEGVAAEAAAEATMEVEEAAAAAAAASTVGLEMAVEA